MGVIARHSTRLIIFYDVEHVNKHFASVCYDPNYSVADVTCFKRSVCNNSCDVVLEPYEVERLLSKMKASSPGLDNIPHWFFRACSFEIAEIVAHILNLSFDCGTVPEQWLSAVVTPVPKVTKPELLTDYRPISVTPLLSRLAEKLVVARWLVPAIPSCRLDDQFGFHPTGSTTCALISLLHHVTTMLERCSHVRYVSWLTLAKPLILLIIRYYSVNLMVWASQVALSIE